MSVSLISKKTALAAAAFLCLSFVSDYSKAADCKTAAECEELIKKEQANCEKTFNNIEMQSGYLPCLDQFVKPLEQQLAQLQAAEQQQVAQQEEKKSSTDLLDTIGNMVASDREESLNDPQLEEDVKALAEIPADGKLDANGNPVSQQRCANAKDNIFKYIACKAMTTLADIRVIVYTLAGFGLIAFAFAAIFNKISWKHLANLCIALFILSMMTPFISYFTYDNGQQIEFGDYLPAGFTNITGSDADKVQNCDTSKGDVCPDVNVDTSAKDTKWSWKDLKNTVKSGINAAKTAYNTYKTVKNTVETTVEQAKKIGTAIKNSGGGLDGVLDTLGQVATASDTIFNTVKTGANAVVANTASIANDIQTAGKSSAELKFDEENQNRIAELEKKLAAGNLTEEQQEWAKAELEQRKAAVDSNKVTDWANTKGKEITDSINKVASTASTASKITRTASSAADQGSNIGGDAVGAIFGLATAAGETIGTIEDNKQAKIDAANAEAKKQAEAEAAAKRQEEIRQNNASYSQGKVWDNSFNAQMDQSKPTVSASVPETNQKETSSSSTSSTAFSSDTSSSDISRTITTTNGAATITLNNATENEDGTITVQDDNGTYGTFDENGNLINTFNYVTGQGWSAEEEKEEDPTNVDWNSMIPSWGAQ